MIRRPVHSPEMSMKRKRQRGAVAVELAIVAPVLLITLLGIAQYGWLLANSMMVASAASAAAQNFAFQRNTSTPYSSTLTQMTGSSALLKSANLSLSTSVNGAQCISDSACASELTNASGEPAQVTVTYTFTPLLKGSVFGLATMPSTLSTTEVDRVQ
jgi:Flp pilus assembly protein TadG